ncbi:MAG: hypothetical protein LQ345_006402 [Seirophora villosa]|nr:MAG: hypothetical protein LQ345_006402 [Seirophora villosa]
MAYNSTTVGVSPGAGSGMKSATNDFQSRQPMNPIQETPGVTSAAASNQQATGSKTEERLERDGHLPGLSDVQNDGEKVVRQPGEEDAAGNKIHRKSFLKKLLHWEHNGANAD